MTTSFPDEQYLKEFADFEAAKAGQRQTDVDRILTSSGVLLNWVGDFLSDPSWKWEKKHLVINDLTMTGTHPEWNEIIIKQAERSPQKFRAMLAADPKLRDLFQDAKLSDRPIMAWQHGDKLKVFDGMHRVIAAIIKGQTEIDGFIGTPPATPKPRCESHVVYDLLRPFLQKRTTDRVGLIAALKYLRVVYANVDELLTTRFSKDWADDDEVQKIISTALAD